LIFFRNSLRKTNISVKIRTFKTCIFYNYSSQDRKFLKIVNFKYKIGTSFKVFQKLKKSPVYKDQIIANNLYEHKSSPVVLIFIVSLFLKSICLKKDIFFGLKIFRKKSSQKKGILSFHNNLMMCVYTAGFSKIELHNNLNSNKMKIKKS
jgi:hypothetical protein